jgi:hypothetical protein
MYALNTNGMSVRYHLNKETACLTMTVWLTDKRERRFRLMASATYIADLADDERDEMADWFFNEFAYYFGVNDV